MQIFKRGKTWVYRFEIAKIKGKRKHQQKGGFKTKKDAEAAGTAALNQYNSSGFTFSPSEISVSDFYDLWINEYCMTNCKATTINGYIKRVANYIKPVIGHYRLCTLTPSSIQNLINDMFNNGFSRNTLISIKGLLTGALDYAVHPLGLIAHNPAMIIRLPSHRATPRIPSRKKVKKPVEDYQLDAILKRFPEGSTCHIPIQIAVRCGLREGEVFALRWEDIDLNLGIIHLDWQVQHINGFWTFVPPKYDSSREVDIDSKLLNLFKRAKAKQEENRIEYAEFYTRYFINEKNQITKENTGREIFLVNVREDGSYIQSRIVSHIGRVVHYELGFKDYDFHSLRHTHATKLYNAGAPLLHLKERLGHCDIKTTEMYTHDNAVLRNRTKTILDEIYKS